MPSPQYINPGVMLPEFARSPADLMIQAIPHALQYAQNETMMPYRQRLMAAQAQEEEAKAANAQLTQDSYRKLMAPGSDPYKLSSGMTLKPEDMFAHNVLKVPESVIWPKTPAEHLKPVFNPQTGQMEYGLPSPGMRSEKPQMGPKKLYDYEEGDQHFTVLQHPDGSVETKTAPRYKPPDINKPDENANKQYLNLSEKRQKAVDSWVKFKQSGQVDQVLQMMFPELAGKQGKITPLELQQYEQSFRRRLQEIDTAMEYYKPRSPIYANQPQESQGLGQQPGQVVDGGVGGYINSRKTRPK